MDPGPFDYVLVGGGTAGLALATRLIEDPTISVCVLEAGEDCTAHNASELTLLGFALKNLGQPKVDWGFMSTPQVNAAKGRSLYLPRPVRSPFPHMIPFPTVNRGHEAEYNAFETLGSPGWGWTGLLEYFKRSQVTFNATAHGSSGPIQRTLPKWISNVQAPLIEGMKSLGIPYSLDGTSGDNVGIWTSNHSIDLQGVRSSSASAYYELKKSSPNVTVIPGAQATHILFSSTRDASGNLIASGVEYHKADGLYTYGARRPRGFDLCWYLLLLNPMPTSFPGFRCFQRLVRSYWNTPARLLSSTFVVFLFTSSIGIGDETKQS
ncbi:GMC oxidoreductase-domain-containing protein [Mycena vitilis]|nr:GMC oxidoreductase-domain-containing protein [Mycena vitilis]